MLAWITLLNFSCEILPIITFVSPATIFLPVLLKQQQQQQQQRPTNNLGRDYQVVNENTTNASCIEMPPLAFTTQMLQCFLWGIYAHQLHMMTLLIPNVFGFLLGFIWSTIYPFKVVSTGGLRTQWQMQYATSWLFMVLGLLTVRKMPYLSSTIAAGVGVLMCTYPLPSMHRALNEKNSNLMGSAAMNFCMFANCVAWLIHSSWWVEYDIFLIVANTAGVIVQAGALTVRVIIARGASTKRSAVVQGEDTAELSVSTPLL